MKIHIFKYLQENMSVGEYVALAKTDEFKFLKDNYLSDSPLINSIAWEFISKVSPHNAENIMVRCLIRPPHWNAVINCKTCGRVPVPRADSPCRWCWVLGEGEESNLESSAGGFVSDSPLPHFYN